MVEWNASCYPLVMTKLFDDAVETVRRLSPESQDEIARTILHLAARDGEPEPIDPAHLPAVLEGLSQVRDGHFSTTAEVETAFRRFEG